MGRIKQFAMATGGSVLIAAATLAVVPTVAGASLQPTSTTVTARPTSTTTGHALVLTAQVAAVTGVASTVRAVTSNVPTGTVTFTITGMNAGTASCKTSNTVTINHAGKAKCHVFAGQLLAADSPYTVVAAYSGDSNFAGSPGTTSVTVTKAKTHTKLKIDSPPVNKSANAVTATVTTLHSGSLLTGTVLFSVSSTPATPKAKRICTNGGDRQPLAVTGNVGTAVCDLQPGWFVISKPRPKNPHQHGSWNVTANYSGDNNFLNSVGTKSGHSSV
jgi:hypothetical protein